MFRCRLPADSARRDASPGIQPADKHRSQSAAVGGWWARAKRGLRQQPGHLCESGAGGQHRASAASHAGDAFAAVCGAVLIAARAAGPWWPFGRARPLLQCSASTLMQAGVAEEELSCGTSCQLLEALFSTGKLTEARHPASPAKSEKCIAWVWFGLPIRHAPSSRHQSRSRRHLASRVAVWLAVPTLWLPGIFRDLRQQLLRKHHA